MVKDRGMFALKKTCQAMCVQIYKVVSDEERITFLYKPKMQIFLDEQVKAIVKQIF